jgi:hypothetical protein
MANNGWKIDDATTVETENTVMLNFNKPDRIVNIIITSDTNNNKKVSVVIQITPK